MKVENVAVSLASYGAGVMIPAIVGIWHDYGATCGITILGATMIIYSIALLLRVIANHTTVIETKEPHP
jgi:hypothetical protein